MGAAKKSISLPIEMYREALKRAKRMGYSTFSEYVQYLVERDLKERPKHSVVREEGGSYSAEAIGEEKEEPAPGQEGKIGFHNKKKGGNPGGHTKKKFHRVYHLDHRRHTPPRDAIKAGDLAAH